MQGSGQNVPSNTAETESIVQSTTSQGDTGTKHKPTTGVPDSTPDAKATELGNNTLSSQDHFTSGPEGKADDKGTKKNPTTEESDSTLAAKTSKQESNGSPVVEISKDHSISRSQGESQVTGSKRRSGTQQHDSISAAKTPKQDSNAVPPSNHSTATENEVSPTV